MLTFDYYDEFSGLLSGGRSYEIKSKTNSRSEFTIRNELFSIGKKLILLQDGKERYIVNRFNCFL